eukprot:TRINITY_DN16634_c0_g1_i2.p3 TRINITY_DN16634_c0_g1~~TRINITY_DN16634_c0_g1_i2.p3  ORF type:complete len:166 (+),score=15.90 TRINITY_DN16634_c0_g1_i2:128-625(+)
MMFSNEKIGAHQIKFILLNNDAQVIFCNCKFDGIGLVAGSPEGESRRGDVVFKNIEIKDVPSGGISVQNCNKFLFENVKVQGCGKRGISIDANSGSMDDVLVQNCVWQGIFVGDIATPLNIRNSSVRSCKYYGLYIEKQKYVVYGTGNTFEGNSWKNVYGNYRQY